MGVPQFVPRSEFREPAGPMAWTVGAVAAASTLAIAVVAWGGNTSTPVGTAAGAITLGALVMATVLVVGRWNEISEGDKTIHGGLTVWLAGALITIPTLTKVGAPPISNDFSTTVQLTGLLVISTGLITNALRGSGGLRLHSVLDASSYTLIPVVAAGALITGPMSAPTAGQADQLLAVATLSVSAITMLLAIALVLQEGRRRPRVAWASASALLATVTTLICFISSIRDAGVLAFGPAGLVALSHASAASLPTSSRTVRGLRNQSFRVGPYMFGGIGTGLLTVVAAVADPDNLPLAIASLLVFSLLVVGKAWHTNLVAKRLTRFIAVEASLLPALIEAPGDAKVAEVATQACQELVGSASVNVTFTPSDVPTATRTDRVYVNSWNPIPDHLRNALEEVALLVETSLDSILAKEEQAVAPGAASIDQTTGFRRVAELERRLKPLSGVLVIIKCDVADHNGDELGDDQIDQMMKSLANRLRAASLTQRRQRLRMWRGHGSTLIVNGSASRADGAEPIWIRRLLRELLAEPILIDGMPTAALVRLGAVELEQPTPPTAALAEARLAADNADRNEVMWFDDDLEAISRRRASIATAFQQALRSPENSGFCVHYQAIVDASTSAPLAVEAFARWVHPTLGAIAPAEFIPIAESEGLIEALDQWVLDVAMSDLDQLHKVCPDLKLHVNVSTSGSMATKIKTLAHTLRLRDVAHADSLVIELAPPALSGGDTRELSAAIQALRDVGVGVALDNFRAGEFSIDRLSAFPFSQIKLATTVDDPAQRDEFVTAAAIVAAMGLPVVAGQVETDTQLATIAETEIGSAQGWLFDRATDLDNTLDWLRAETGAETESSAESEPGSEAQTLATNPRARQADQTILIESRY